MYSHGRDTISRELCTEIGQLRTEMRETHIELGELRTSVQPLLAQSFVTTDLTVTRNLVEKMTQEMIVQLEPRLVPVPRRRR